MQHAMTQSLHRSLAQAHEEARALQSRYVSTEHLLLGLLADPECAGRRVLERLGLDASRVAVALADMVRQEGPAPTLGPLPFTARARRALALALEAAEGLDHDLVTTADLLLGLLDEGDGVAWMLLDRLEVTRDRVNGAPREDLAED